jgi:hypothetical protein
MSKLSRETARKPGTIAICNDENPKLNFHSPRIPPHPTQLAETALIA